MNIFNFRSLQTKLIAAFLVVVSVTALVGVISLMGLNRVSRGFEEITTSEVTSLEGVGRALLALQRANSALGFALAERGDDNRAIERLLQAELDFNRATLLFDMFVSAYMWGSDSEAFRNISGGILYAEWKRQELDQEFLILKAGAQEVKTATEAKIFFGVFVSRAQKLFSEQRRALRLVHIEGRGGEREYIDFQKEISSVKFLSDRISASMNMLVAQGHVVIQSEIRRQESIFVSLRQIVSAAIIFAVFGSALLGFFFARRFIGEPVEELAEVARAIAQGNVSRRAKEGGEDELAHLAVSFNTMADNLVRLGKESKTIIEAMPEPLFILNTMGEVIDVNPAALSITGYARDEIIGMRAEKLFSKRA